MITVKRPSKVSVRARFIIHWPGRIPAGRVSNEIVHEVDTFTTFAATAGAAVPTDRPIVISPEGSDRGCGISNGPLRLMGVSKPLA
jgi:hypothetical protein